MTEICGTEESICKMQRHGWENLKTGAGHISYSIKKDYRGRGYGTAGNGLSKPYLS